MKSYENCYIRLTKNLATRISTVDGDSIEIFFAEGSILRASGVYEQKSEPGKFHVSLVPGICLEELLYERAFDVQKD